MTSRRDFLSAVGAASFVGALPGSRHWPAAEMEAKIKPIGLQLYTVRDLMEHSVNATLATVAKIGYREVSSPATSTVRRTSCARHSNLWG